MDDIQLFLALKNSSYSINQHRATIVTGGRIVDIAYGGLEKEEKTGYLPIVEASILKIFKSIRPYFSELHIVINIVL